MGDCLVRAGQRTWKIRADRDLVFSDWLQIVHIVKAAKHLFSATKKETADFSADWQTGDISGSLDKRVRFLEAKLIELSDEQRSSAELIKSLAEQNALMVEAIEVFRVRVKMLLTVCILLLGGLAAVIFRLVV